MMMMVMMFTSTLPTHPTTTPIVHLLTHLFVCWATFSNPGLNLQVIILLLTMHFDLVKVPRGVFLYLHPPSTFNVAAGLYGRIVVPVCKLSWGQLLQQPFGKNTCYNTTLIIQILSSDCNSMLFCPEYHKCELAIAIWDCISKSSGCHFYCHRKSSFVIIVVIASHLLSLTMHCKLFCPSLPGWLAL